MDENIGGLYRGAEVHFIVAGDINSRIKNFCAKLEILAMLNKVTVILSVHTDGIIFFLPRQ